MSVSGPTLALCFLNNDTEFRAWAQVIHDKLVACGQTQTSDTGQINLVTVAKPAGTNTAAGYEIFRFNDTLQATAPLFYKVEYGTAAAATTPSIWIQVGSGTNGAGTLTGLLSTRVQLIPAASSTGTTKNVYASGANNRIWLAGGIDWASNANTYQFQIERTKDASGADTADGYYLQMLWGSSGASFQSALWAGGASTAVAAGPLVPIVSSRTAVGTDVGLVPGFYYQGKPFYSTMLGAASADVPGNLVYSVTYLGASRSYLSFGLALNLLACMASSSFYPQLLWE